MEDKKAAVKPKLQWHPAFYAGLQIVFEKESEELVFENEHQLGTKPKVVDVLITKKNDNYQVKKKIGKFFRKYNLIEYKSPQDYLNIDDYYKVCSYAGFFKVSSGNVDEIKSDEITITFATFHHPRKLMSQLEERGLHIRKVDKGIYYIEGGIFPIQLVVTRLIDEEDNFWLRNLTDKLKSTEKVQEQYQKHSENKLYKSVMDIIVKANEKLFNRREEEMCQALFDIYKDDLMKMAMERARKEVVKMAEEEVIKMAEEKAVKIAEEKAVKIAEEKAVKIAEEKAVKMAEEKALEKVLENQKKNIINLMNNAHFTLQQALDVLMVPEEERKLYNLG